MFCFSRPCFSRAQVEGDYGVSQGQQAAAAAPHTSQSMETCLQDNNAANAQAAGATPWARAAEVCVRACLRAVTRVQRVHSVLFSHLVQVECEQGRPKTACDRCRQMKRACTLIGDDQCLRCARIGRKCSFDDNVSSNITKLNNRAQLNKRKNEYQCHEPARAKIKKLIK